MHLSYRTVYRTIRTSRIGAGCIPFRRDALRIGLWALCRTNLVNKKLIIIYLLIQVLILRKFLLKYLLMTCNDFSLIKIDYIFWLYRLFHSFNSPLTREYLIFTSAWQLHSFVMWLVLIPQWTVYTMTLETLNMIY